MHKYELEGINVAAVLEKCDGVCLCGFVCACDDLLTFRMVARHANQIWPARSNEFSILRSPHPSFSLAFILSLCLSFVVSLNDHLASFGLAE